MTRDQFEAALDRYGGDLSRWPPMLRADAETLVGTDGEAAAALRAARRLDALLAEATAPATVDAALVGRIVARNRTRHSDIELRPTRRLAFWASTAAILMLVTGFAAGAVIVPDASSDAFAALLFSDGTDDLGGELL
jgi:hypothetical protein